MSAVIPPTPNGLHPIPPLDKDREAQYSKIILLAEQILAGIHPRLKLPDHAAQTVVARVSSASNKPTVPLPTPILPAPPASNSPFPKLQGSVKADAPRLQVLKLNGLSTALPTSFSSSKIAQSTFSGIDPVLLQKSDDLVRAETQLARQRAERLLKEQFENKRADARKRPNPQEAKADIDLSTSLARALNVANAALQKPESPPNGGSGSDSFDENSYYSSKAPDSPPEQVVRGRDSPSLQHQPHQISLDDLGADRVAEAQHRREMQTGLPDPQHRIVERPEYLSSANGRPLAPSWSTRVAATADLTSMDVDEEEEEYSPPEPAEQIPLTIRPEQQVQYDPHEPIRRPLRRYSEVDNAARRYVSPPEADMRIVRNHILSPIAPQPSRISSLTSTKQPLISQSQRLRKDRNRPVNGRPESRSSPELNNQQNHQRKRRRLDKRGRRRGPNGSPGPHIKDEPISPPPFHDKQPLGAKSRAMGSENPIYIDDTPVQQVRYLEQSDRAVLASPRPPMYEDNRVFVQSEPRPISRASLRPIRDDQDLRKVASLHNLRADHAREYVQPAYDSPSRNRAVSYVPIDREAHLEPRPYPEQSMSFDREINREQRIASSPMRQYSEAPVRRYDEPTRMPKRRIMIDEYGNEVVYEMVQPSRPAVAPRPSFIDEEDINDNAYARNQATAVYGAARDRRYLQEMPPPQVAYRRIAETPRMAPAEAQIAGRDPQAELKRMQRAASVQVPEYDPRQPLYANENEPPRMRMSSVRPAASRYEDAREVVQRVQSVRPDGRDTSAYTPVRSQLRVEDYMPLEAPRYRMVSQDGRYYEVRE